MLEYIYNISKLYFYAKILYSGIYVSYYVFDIIFKLLGIILLIIYKPIKWGINKRPREKIELEEYEWI
jgi:hypothetical protein